MIKFKLNKDKMKSILNHIISGYANYHDTTPVDVNLLSWLTSSKYKNEVLAIRKNEDKKQRDRIKATLPAITPSGIFSERKADGLIKHSGFIQFDIDNILDVQGTRKKITSLSEVAYLGLSVSGRGLWGLIPIAEPDHHKQYFEFIQKAFLSMGIKVDTSCKDVSRLRGYSYDPHAYFNHSATTLNKSYRQKKITRKSHFKADSGHFEADRIEYCLNEINARDIDLTANYNDWFAIGCSFASLGEAGRPYFHAVSQNYDRYNATETDKQFDKCLKSAKANDLSTFFGKCKAAGILYKDGIKESKFEPIQHKETTPLGYPSSWDDITPDYSDKWQLINHLINENMEVDAAKRFAQITVN